MNRKNKIDAVIPAKGRSTRCKNKNIRPFTSDKKSLLVLQIDKLYSLDFIGDVYVSTDDDAIAEVVIGAGGIVVKRSQDLCSDHASMNDVYKHLATLSRTDDLIYTSVTTPFISMNSYYEAYDKYSANNNKCVHTMSSVKDFLILNGKPINFDKQKFPRSQDLPSIQKVVYGFSIITKEEFYSTGSSLGNSFIPQVLASPEDLDIDDESEFLMAQVLWERSY